jgi:hypothetical protein
MGKEMIYIDFTDGKKQLDTSKMEQWTQEEWKEWIGEPEDYVGIQKVLFSDSDFYMKLTRLHYDEAGKDMYVTFEAQNKTDRNFSIQFGRWRVDDEEFDLSNSMPEFLGGNSDIIHFRKSVKYMFLKSTIIMEVNIIDVDNNTTFREFEFTLKIYS